MITAFGKFVIKLFYGLTATVHNSELFFFGTILTYCMYLSAPEFYELDGDIMPLKVNPTL
jgi:hypothetical protein